MKLSEELREHFYSMSKSVSAEDDLIEKVEALESQIEAMRNCDNCKYEDGSLCLRDNRLTQMCSAPDYQGWQMKEDEE